MKARVAAVLATATVLSGCSLSFQDVPVGRAPEGESYHLTLVFQDASNLPIGGKVQLGQAVVGRVSELRAKDFQAQVTIAVRQDVRLPAGTKAQLQVTSALGEEFIALEPGSGQGTLADGAVIGLADTSRGPSVEDLLAAAGTVLNGAGIDQLRTIVTETNTALGGREQEVRDLLTRLDSLLASVDAHRGELTRTIDSVSALTTTVNNERATLEAGLTRITPALQVIIDQRGTLDDLFGRVGSLSRVTQNVLGKTEDQVLTLTRQVRPLLDEVGGLNDSLGHALAGIAPFQQRLAAAVPGDYLNLDGTVDVPNTLLPLLTGQPPPAPGSEPEPVTLQDFLAKGTR
ncbi:MCE family protein [Amycolatopsis acidicola]|uniref:MCE family protein n=1 Tax=Amycolatopsis acidicola TaxID=2596893 RepID=A0A5N0URH0_9PSEU|nr:MCE family protein [Amycolatopsis acidicola]KAA9151161.1 MCE family protein [Amycolatopsis acidicola]